MESNINGYNVKIIHVITTLTHGGAEAVLYRLCSNDRLNTHIVVSLMDEGIYAFGPSLQKVGIAVHYLNMPRSRVTISGVIKLFRLIRNLKPDVVQTWMYHADLIGGIVAKLAGVKQIYWNIRNSTLELGKSKYSTIMVLKLCAKLSGFLPKGIVCCAYKAKEVHATLGYDAKKMFIIGNGYDLSIFKESPDLGRKFREELNLAKDTRLLGMVGRFDPQKDHFGLLEALNLVKQAGFEFRFCLVGDDLNFGNIKLIEKIKELDLIEEIILLDRRSDIPVVMNGLDIHLLSSAYGEAFPNVVAEAMACGTPCVTTDVGDAALIVGDTGWVVPPANAARFAEGIAMALKECGGDPDSWQTRREAARTRVIENFGLEKMITAYHAVWRGEGV